MLILLAVILPTRSQRPFHRWVSTAGFGRPASILTQLPHPVEGERFERWNAGGDDDGVVLGSGRQSQ